MGFGKMLSSTDLLHQNVLRTILDELPEDEREMPVVLWLTKRLNKYEEKRDERK
jgi:hypothetical protein